MKLGKRTSVRDDLKVPACAFLSRTMPLRGGALSSTKLFAVCRIDKVRDMSAPTPTVPKAMLGIYERIVSLTDGVCDRHLDCEYRDMARAMAAALCRKRPSPVACGEPRSWACGIVYAIGRLNFLSDRSFPPSMTTAQLCAAFAVSESTGYAKARAIESALRTARFDVQWTLPSRVANNPRIWFAEFNGLIVDLRHMPRQVQEVAFAKGMIPYIPADREEARA